MRPGVPKFIVRRSTGLRKLRQAIGKKTYEGITVEGHCMGIQARTWRNPAQPAGYDYAYDGAKAVIAAGKMRHVVMKDGKWLTKPPPRGVLLWWSTGSTGYPGHVATTCGAKRTKVLGNVGKVIKRAPVRSFKYQLIGWCYPGDVPGWTD